MIHRKLIATLAAALPAISGENQMPTATLSQAEPTVAPFPANYFLENFTLRADKSALITTVASFPANYFLENLALRADNSALVTAMNRKELWYVPPAAAADTVTPILLHTFEQLTFNLNEVEPDVFYLITSNVYTNHEGWNSSRRLHHTSAASPSCSTR
jgi:hypothetical protein